MKALSPIILAILLIGCFSLKLIAQEEEDSSPVMVITKNDGTQYLGTVIKMDEREVLMETEELGTFYIPRHEIKSMRNVKAEEMIGSTFVGESRFATRYFYSTNGLPIKKGEHYAMVSVYGPEVHFAAGKNLSVGLMTSWLATPIVGSFKYSIPVSDKVSLGVGSLVGSMAWTIPDAFGALGFGSITFGNRVSNLTFSGGGAYINSGDWGGSGSAPLASVAGMTKVGKNASLVFDSFIYLGESKFALLIPGIRLNPSERSAFQFGFGGLIIDGFVAPIPMISYFVSLN